MAPSRRNVTPFIGLWAKNMGVSNPSSMGTVERGEMAFRGVRARARSGAT